MPNGRKEKSMEHIKDILPRVHKDLMDKAEQLAYEKMIEYIQDIGDYYEDPAEKQAANEVYDSYMSDLDKLDPDTYKVVEEQLSNLEQLNNALGKQVCITMISGEVITGKVVQHNKVTAYIEVQQNYNQEELEQAITVFGKDYVEKYLMKPTTILTLPIDEIQTIND